MSATMRTGSGGAGDRSRPDILFVITDFQVGGSERQLALLASTLAKDGMNVAVFGFMDGPVRAELRRAGVEPILAWGAVRFQGKIPVSLPLAAAHLLLLMLRQRPRMAHFFLPAAYLVGAPLAVLAGVPVRIMSRRSLNDYQKNRFFKIFERQLHGFMHAILGNSSRIVGQLIDEGAKPERLGLIYNGVDNLKYQVSGGRAAYRERQGISPNALVMCMVANLIPYKGHRDLIAALAIASPSLPTGWRLLVVGRDDGIGRDLKELVARNNLRDNVMFLGPQVDVAPILATCDIGILVPSGNEGLSNSILEGMAAGLPMIVTNIGGNAEVVIDGVTGLVVPAEDPAGLSNAIIRLAGDQTLRAKAGDAGRKRAVEYFSVDRFVDGHRKLYEALAAGRRPCDVAELRV